MDALKGSSLALCALLLGCASASSSSSAGPDAQEASVAWDEPDTSPPLDYPAGPYGMKVGQTFADFELDGYRDGRTFTRLRLRDLYDPLGEKGITAIYLSIGAGWCPSCRGEASSLPAAYPRYREKGARFFSVLIEDASHKPASRSSLDAWISEYKTNYDLVADPSFASIPNASSGGSIALPYDMAIDPRTMRVTYVKSGPIFLGSDGMPGVDELIAKNRR